MSIEYLIDGGHMTVQKPRNGKAMWILYFLLSRKFLFLHILLVHITI